MSFVPDVPSEAFAEEIRYAVTKPDGSLGRTVDIFHKLAHSPPVFLALADATSATLRAMKLDGQLRELAICAATQARGGFYPYCKHVDLSRRLGISEEKLLAIAFSERHPAFTEPERAVIAFARELTQTGAVGEDARARIAAFLDHRERVELAWTVGFYNAVSLITSACDIALEESAPEVNALR